MTDSKNGYQTHEGIVRWISSEAEFTPRQIQTREERVHLVYAVKIDVPNPNGILKTGMPAEVIF
jgi:HlyD family secretion protein